MNKLSAGQTWADLKVMQTGNGSRESYLRTAWHFMCVAGLITVLAVGGGGWKPLVTVILSFPDTVINDWLCLLFFQCVAHGYNFYQLPAMMSSRP